MNAHRKWIKSLKVAKTAKANTARENENIKNALDTKNRSKNSKL